MAGVNFLAALSCLLHLTLSAFAVRCWQVGGSLQAVLQEPGSQVLWCPIHPEPQDVDAARQQYPLFFDDSLPRPLRVEVSAACAGRKNRAVGQSLQY